MTTPQTQVFIADDHQAIVDAIKVQIENEQDLAYKGAAVNQQELINRLNEQVDVLLLDVICDEPEFLALIRSIMDKYPLIRILILSGKEDLLFAQQTVECGARGYISKALGLADICSAIRKIYRFPNLNLIELPNVKPSDYERLEVKKLITARELQVISLLCKGFTSEKIADFLSKINKDKTIMVSTVKAHRKNIRTKLRDYDVTNDASLGYWIAKWDLLDGTELSTPENPDA